MPAFNRGTKFLKCPFCRRRRYSLLYSLGRKWLGVIAYGCHHEWRVLRIADAAGGHRTDASAV